MKFIIRVADTHDNFIGFLRVTPTGINHVKAVYIHNPNHMAFIAPSLEQLVMKLKNRGYIVAVEKAYAP